MSPILSKIKNTTLTCLFATIYALPANGEEMAYPAKGEKTVCVGAGYVSRNKSASAGVVFSYRFGRVFSLAPSVDYIFRHNDYDGLMINLDTRYSLPLTTPRWDIYPLAGINITSWTYHHPRLEEESDDVTTRTNRMGLNAGLGIAFRATPTLKLVLEGKESFVKSASTTLVKISIGYTF